MSSPYGYNPIEESAPGLPRHNAGLPGPRISSRPATALERAIMRVVTGLVLFAALPWTALYAFVLFAGLAASAGAYFLLRTILPGLDPATAIAWSSLAYLLPLWPVSRWEHRFAAGCRPYRAIRHVWRLALVGGGVYFLIPGSPPERILLALLAAAAMHFLLRNKTLHGEWHKILDRVWLREPQERPAS
jgi:hypothetical protein